MQIYLDSFGAFLAVRNGMFLVRVRPAAPDGGVVETTFAVREVGAILLTKGTSLSTDAALLAVENDIPVLLIDAQTHYPLAQVSGGRPGSTALIRKNQAQFARQSAGFQWVADQLAEKIAGQRRLLQQFADHPLAPNGFANDLALGDRVMASMERSFRQFQPEPDWNAAVMEAAAGRFRGQEGTASRLYFQQIGKLLAGRLEFVGRQKRPAYDPFNALLNYLYGMLYTSVHLALLKSGLDPYLGILHADRYGGAPTLVFDAIEPWRPWADQVAVHLVLGDAISADFFEPDAAETGLWLSRVGKSAVIDAMLGFLQESTAYTGAGGVQRKVRRGVQIDLEAQKLAVFLKEWSVS